MIPPHLIPRFDPSPNPQAVVRVPNMRITVLTTRVFRLEYSKTDQFTDQPSQVFWYRNHPTPPFDVEKIIDQSDDSSGEILKVETADLKLQYSVGEIPSSGSLSILVKSVNHSWRFGDINQSNLKGTYRTLDERAGKVDLENGLLARDGWTIIDDSNTLVFNDNGWLEPRKEGENNLDLYFFGYGLDYQSCISDFRLLTGRVPLIPRWVLGNWWSRYWAYDQNQILDLIQDFQDHEVPLSVFIIDMDWHITDTGNESSGWTGYTWNRVLFPDPVQLIEHIHRQGLKTALNLHPAEGVYPHEERYSDFAQAMGLDPATETPIPFDLGDPVFARAYFEILHHPLEGEGVDFWWIDWQQGYNLSIPGLDPLFWLNHLHFLDLNRCVDESAPSPSKRPFIFSRWGGLGNHRYPIGFSGDTIISWESLTYQPFFTATAANVCYGWWSHDIGGHMGGIEDPELYTRWVQFGLLSPIFRLHSTKNPFHERRPFAFDAEVSRIASHAMRLRHSFIPYLYTMAWLDHQEAIAPVRPLYHLEPKQEPAYYCPDTYTFGTELIAAPYTHPAGPETRLSRQKIWLPEGNWFNFFTGEPVPSGHHVIYGGLSQIPLYAKAGAIIPILPLPNWGGTDIPSHLRVNIFPGADNTFTLYEDDSNTNKYLENVYALTPFKLINNNKNNLQLQIGPVKGHFDQLPQYRTFELKFWGISEPDACSLEINRKSRSIYPEYNPNNHSLTVPLDFEIAPEDVLNFTLSGIHELVRSPDYFTYTLETCKRVLKDMPIETIAKSIILDLLPEILQNPELLTRSRPILTDNQLRVFLEIITRTGVHRITHTGEDAILLWNENPLQDSFPITYHLSVNQYSHGFYDHPYHYERGPVPNFKVLQPPVHFMKNPWELRVNYGNVLTILLSSTWDANKAL
jgi:alpha-glucosidase (family GH31 glycosyl hydrolase)